MAFKFNSIALLLSSLLTGGGAWLSYELYKPKIVKDLIVWKGFSLATEEDSGIWEALYFQSKSELGDKAKDASTLKSFCTRTAKERIDYSSKNFEYVEKFCVNVLKSRKARIIAKGSKEIDFLDSDDDYKLAFILNRYSATFLSLLGKPNLTQDTEIAEDSDLLKAYKDYCEGALKEDDTKIAVVKQLCLKRKEKTATEWLRKEGYELKNESELREEFKNYEQKGDLEKQPYVVGSTFLEAIKDTSQGEDSWVPLVKDQNKFFERFNQYCNDHKDKFLFEKDFLKKTYPEFKARCAKESKQSS